MQTGCSFKLSTRRRIAGGIALAMIATLLVVAATTLAIRMTRQVEDRTERVSKTQARMERIRAALHAHAASQGRLPCPANGAQDTGLAVPVAAAVMCTHRDGTVPWVSLGLQAEDALDGWGHKISYRVPDSFVQVDSVKSSNSSTAGLKVKDYLVDRYKLAWVLISHGASGLGAWRVFLPQMALPGAGGNEWDNTQAAPVEFFRRGEALVDPATGVEYALNNAAHFDDVLLYESIEDLKNRSGFDLNTRMTTRRLDSGPGGKVTYTGRNANTASITFDSSTEWGNMTLASTGGTISRNADGTGIGVCSGACATDAESALDSSKSLGFKLSGGKTADKFALGVLSLDPTVQISFTFKLLGANVGVPVVYPALPNPPAVIIPYERTVVPNLMPSTATPFDEVVVQPLGSSRFFIASIRFCTAAENCN